MRNFRIIEHTADVIIQVQAETYVELFQSALEGLCEVILHNNSQSDVKANILKKIEINAIDSSALIVDFLSEALCLMHITKAILPYVEFDFLDSNTCRAELFGYSVDGFDEDVKGVTYHRTNIIKDKYGVFSVEILLDI